MSLPEDELCIMLPTINELENLAILLPEIRKIFKTASILIVDDNSNDGTRYFLNSWKKQDPKLRVIFRNNRFGIGSAHMLGIERISNLGFKFLITMDADLTHKVADAKLIFDALLNSDVVIGSRYLGKSDIEGWAIHRLILTKIGHWMTQIFFFSNLDMSSGLRGYRLESIPIPLLNRNCPNNYEFFFVSTLVFLRSKLRISQVRVVLQERGSGKSKMSLKLALRGGSQLVLYGFRFKRIK